jgi:hypothetical protein
MTEKELIAWLLDSDPSIRWQVLRDLTDADLASIAEERQKVATEGWGAKLLSFQDSNGLWGGQLYSHKWLSTTYSLQLLVQLGLDPGHPQAQLACNQLLEGGFRAQGGISYTKSSDIIDNGVTGMILSLLAYFNYQDPRIHIIAQYLNSQQLADGSWNPVAGNTNLKYRFDSTLLALSGLREYEGHYSSHNTCVVDSLHHGQEFLLKHLLYKHEMTDETVNNSFKLLSFPPRWHYDILTALDYFQDCRDTRDKRLGDAAELLRKKRNREGSWNLQHRHAGKTYFEMETPGQPSKWNTLRALRVLHWWDGR